MWYTKGVSDLLVTNVRPWGAEPVDLEISGGTIAAIHPVGSSPAGEGASAPTPFDGEGRVALPAFTDAHVHLDSTRIGLPYRPSSLPPGHGIWDCIMNDRDNWRDAGASVAERASTTLGRAIANGMTRARSYAQVDADCGLERLEGVVAAKQEHAARAQVQIVAFPQAGLFVEPGVPQLIDQAMTAGADVVGGIDPCSLERDPVRHLDTVFEIAARHDAPIDVHLHEPGDLGAFSASMILDRIKAHGCKSKVTIAHAYFLATLPQAKLEPLLDEFAQWDVALTTIAPRLGLPIESILSRGIRIGLGQDGQRDYWSPYGNTDMLDRAWQLAFTQGYRRDQQIEDCLAVASLGGADVIDGHSPGSATNDEAHTITGRAGLSIGDVADVVLVPADNAAAAVMDRSQGRAVIHGGALVADNGELLG